LVAANQWLLGHLASLQQAGGSHLLQALLLLLVWSSSLHLLTGLLLLVRLQSVLLAVSHLSRTPIAATHDHLRRGHQVQQDTCTAQQIEYMSHPCHV
jgi:hypothetical protein